MRNILGQYTAESVAVCTLHRIEGSVHILMYLLLVLKCAMTFFSFKMPL